MKLEFPELIKFIRTVSIDISREETQSYTTKGKDTSISTDHHLNQQICSYLDENFNYPILSEENDNKKNYLQYDDYFWILDPLDGSLNYYRDIPLYCISISLWRSAIPLVGIIFDIPRNSVYMGFTSNGYEFSHPGAWLDNEKMFTSVVKGKKDGVICTGFPSLRSYEKESIEQFIKTVQDWKKVRLIGSAALSLAWVAAGKADAYIEEDIRIWDVAAGLAIVKAAGGEIYLKPNNRPNFVTAAATNGKIPVSEII